MSNPAVSIVRRNGAPGRIRTCDPKLRRLVLCPTELRARGDACSAKGGAGKRVPAPLSFVNSPEGEEAGSAAAVADRIRRIRIGDAGAAAATTAVADRIAGIAVGDAGAIATATAATAATDGIIRIAIGDAGAAATATPAAAAGRIGVTSAVAIGAALGFGRRGRRFRRRSTTAPSAAPPITLLMNERRETFRTSSLIALLPATQGCLKLSQGARRLCR